MVVIKKAIILFELKTNKNIKYKFKVAHTYNKNNQIC